ncbi:hypothetical protein [Flavobacterium sp.]|uniref:hypothetical protein n=1 Tax=Flavobacterium sp. TaxID=239 RepID=UPI0039E72114
MKEKESIDYTKWISLLINFVGLPLLFLNFRRTGRFKNFDFLSEVDKQLIATPQLWRIYDTKAVKLDSQPILNLDGHSKMSIKGIENILFKNEITVTGEADETVIKSEKDFIIDGEKQKVFFLKKGISVIITPAQDNEQALQIDGAVDLSNCTSLVIEAPLDKEINDKVEAFCYYKLNNFESVFKNFGYFKQGPVFESWERYLIETLITSKPFRKVVGKALKRDYLSEEFSNRLEKYQKISEALKESHRNFENDNIDKAAYKKIYQQQLKKHLPKRYFWQKKKTQNS